MTMTAYEKWMDDMEAKGVRGLSLRQAFAAGQRDGKLWMHQHVRVLLAWDGYNNHAKLMTDFDLLAKEIDDGKR